MLRVFLAVAAALLGGPLAAQRGVAQLTTSTAPNTDPLVSPDGRWVAFRAPGKITMVPFQGGPESDLIVSANLGSFLWTPSSSGLYFIEDSDLRFVSRGGAASTVAALPGLAHRIWCVDGADSTVWGTRFDPVTSSHRIFTVTTSGGQLPVDIVFGTGGLVLDEIRLDPTEAFIVYRCSVQIPFPPVEFFMANADGTAQTSLSQGPIATGCPAMAEWVDNGNTIAFAITSQTSFRPHLARLSQASPQVDFLTEGTTLRRNSVITADRRWIVHEAAYNGSTGLATGPALLPTAGGGHVPLTADDEVDYTFHGKPSIDDAGANVAFAAAVGGATPKIFAVQLDRELHVFPRVEIGQPFTIELPTAASEIGVVWLGYLSTPALPLPGFTYGLALDIGSMALVGAGVPGAGVLSLTLNVPNRPSLQGLSLWIQGLRTINFTSGDFSRYAEIRIF